MASHPTVTVAREDVGPRLKSAAKPRVPRRGQQSTEGIHTSLGASYGSVAM